MHIEHEDGGMECEASNIRFLIQRQVEILDALDRRGLVDRGARDLLRRLMQREEEIRVLVSCEKAG